MKAGEVLNLTNLESIKHSLGLVKFQIIEKSTGQTIDEFTIQEVENINDKTVIKIKSSKLHPGQNSRFMFMGNDNWMLLFRDPMNEKEFVYCNNGPDYELKLC